MKENRLSGLALIHVYTHDVSLNSEEVVSDFAASRSRKMEHLLGLPIIPRSQMTRREERLPF